MLSPHMDMHDNEALKNFLTNMAKSDSRFEAIASDPRFNLPKKRAVKSKIDDRFKSALEGDAFKVKTMTDRYGRKLEKKTAKEQLERFYDFDDQEKDEKADSDSDSSDEGSDSNQKPSILDRMRGNVESSQESESEDESDSVSGSDSDREGKDSKSEVDIENDVDEYDLGKSQVATGDESCRLAVVNLDWDNLRAADLMVTFNSFIPKTSKINSVSIYPSEFGKQRMSEEDIKGPGLEASNKKATEHDKDRDFSSKALRKYQLQRLQYYYAIVDCDAVSTAASIYNNCDGTEYEATANVFDIRFVPDEITFDDAPSDQCTSVPINYAPQEFITSALQHSKAQLTWDETPKERKDFAARAFSRAEEDDMDLKAYLASDSESESERTSADKYRALLGQSSKTEEQDSEDENDVDMEITFKSALDEGNAVLDVNSTKQDPLENLSTIDKYRLKEKERRQKRIERAKARKAEEEEEQVDEKKKKAELELMLMDDTKAPESEDESKSKDKKKKYKKTKTREKRDAMAEAEADFNTADPRFQALFEDPDYAIDSTNPQFKKTKAMDKVLDERRRRAPTEEKSHKSGKRKSSSAKKEDSVSDLVASLRNKKLKTKK